MNRISSGSFEVIPGSVETPGKNDLMKSGDRGVTSVKVPLPIIALVHIQRSASTSLKFALKNSVGFSHCDVNAIDSQVVPLATLASPKYIASQLFHKLVYRPFLKRERRKKLH